MITEYNKLSGLDKVAVLFSVLGEGLAVSLMKGLSETEVRKIRARVREMGTISFSIKKQIVEDFYLAFVAKKFQNNQTSEARKPFEYLSDLADEQLLALLEVEEPRIIALALAQVPGERQVFVMNRLSPDVKARVLMELGNLSEIPLEAVVNIANQLREKSYFLPKGVEFSRGGSKNIADILGQLSPDEERRFLDVMSKESPELVREIKKFYFTFEDIFSFPDNLLRDIMNAVELDTIALAMKGQPEELLNRVIENLPQKKQAMYEPVEGAVPRRNVDEARKKILDVARQMEKEGRFKLEDILGGAEMVE